MISELVKRTRHRTCQGNFRKYGGRICLTILLVAYEIRHRLHHRPSSHISKLRNSTEFGGQQSRGIPLAPCDADKTLRTDEIAGRHVDSPTEPLARSCESRASDNPLGRLTGLDIAGVSQSEIPGRSGYRFERRQGGRTEAGR